MAEDNLNDLDEEFNDELENILDNSSLDGIDGSDFYGSDQNEFDGKLSSKDESLKRNSLAGVMQKLFGRFKLKKILVMAAVLIGLSSVIGGGLFVFVFDGGPKDNKELRTAEGQQKRISMPREDKVVFEDIVSLEPFERLHLKTSSTKGLLSLSISLELSDQQYRTQILAVEDSIRQITTTQVAEMTWLELRNPEGKIRLKYDLLRRFNTLFPKAMVSNVFFTYFIMQ